jgi:hypothetical protein
LRDELQRVRKWWRESCDAEIAGREHPCCSIRRQ